MAIAAEQGKLAAGDHIAMLGIGSGINCIMLGVEWQTSSLTVDHDESHGLSKPHAPALSRLGTN
jgi:hypothetical protein